MWSTRAISAVALVCFLQLSSLAKAQSQTCALRNCPTFSGLTVRSSGPSGTYTSCGYVSDVSFNCYYDAETGQYATGNTRCASAPRSVNCAYCNTGNRYTPEGNCSKCPVGSVSQGGLSGACTPCQSPSAPDSTNSKCLCPAAGTGLDVYNNCVACDPGSYNPGTSSTCSSCQAGRYCPSTGSTTPIPCPAGTFSTATGASDASTCQSCMSGTYQPNTGSRNCFTCNSALKLTSNAARTACVCQPGYANRRLTTTSGNQCDQTLCPAGEYTDGTTACLQCGPGTISTPGRGFCQPCPPGSYRSNDSCELCGLGEVSPGQSDACTVCTFPLVPNAEHSACVLPPSPAAGRKRQARKDSWR